MATYEINGNTYEMDDSIQGEPLKANLLKLQKMSGEDNLRKFREVLGKAEGSDYNTIVGGGKLSDFSKHPNVVGVTTANGPSTAAGKYQITGTTYKDIAPKLGITDFSPASQDRIADELIRQSGALDDVKKGNFMVAAGKLGGRWASLPSSTSGQAKRSTAWLQQQFGITPQATAAPAPAPAPAARTAGYMPFAQVREDVDPASLVNDIDWLRASKRMYEMREKQTFRGDAEVLAEYGKRFMGDFNFNIPSMAMKAHTINNGSQEDKEAFLYMMDTYDNTKWTMEGAGRATTAILTDPTTYVGLGTLGVGLGGKAMAASAAKLGVKQMLKQAIGRTGIIAGAEGAIYGATDNTIRQGVEVSAGRKESFHLDELAAATGVGAVGGVVLGSAADMAVTAVTGVVRRAKLKRAAAAAPRVEPSLTTQAIPPVDAIGAPTAAPGALPGANPHASPELPLEEVLRGPTPLGGSLNEVQIAEATARKQKGRLWVDDLPPVVPANPDLVATMTLPDRNTGLRSTVQNMDELTEHGASIADQLRVLDDTNLAGALEQFRVMPLAREDGRVVERGIQMYADELRIEKKEVLEAIHAHPAGEQTPALIAKLDALDNRMVPLELADDAYGSSAASILRQRQEGLQNVRGVSVETLMTEQNLTRQEAERAYVRLIEEAQQSTEGKAISNAYDRQIQEAIDAGDLRGAAELASLKHTELPHLAEAAAPGASSFMQKLNEFAISNVFSPTTVAVNIVPSAIKTVLLPLVKAVVSNPLEKATRVEMAASYGAIKSTVGAAMRAAKASFRYEQGLLTNEGMRLMDGQLAIRGRVGAAIRTIPRILAASDEFLAHLNYAGYVSGKAAAGAATEGTAKGLTGKALSDFIKERVTVAAEAAYKPASGDVLVQPIINKGLNLGYTGVELAKYVEREAVRDPAALRAGNDQEALAFVRDVLYKRPFSGEGLASAGAKMYEEFTHKAPALKFIVGQLFFRTPIRVFEEGIRLTPGIQILAPNFMKDLAGTNGASRQVRAQAEALTSIAVAGAVLTLYSEGRLKGDGAYDDWRAARTRSDGPQADAYTLKMDDNSTWTYRSFDPVATPVKIMLNGLERLDKLAIREGQGEYIGKDLYKGALAHVTTGTMAIASALRDANLVAGVNGTIKFFESLGDPEGKEAAFLKLFGEKLSMMVPNTLHKIAKQNDPTIKDPATFWQVVETRLDSIGADKTDIQTAYSYDVLGEVRTRADSGTLWNIFSTATAEERGRGHSEEHQFVLTELDRLQRETGAVFAPPLKHPMVGQFDLRTVRTSDGTETLYDRWQANYRALKPDEVLAPILREPLPDGTFKFKGVRVEVVQNVMNELREAAFLKTMAEEQQVLDKYIELEKTKALSRAGQFDIPK